MTLTAPPHAALRPVTILATGGTIAMADGARAAGPVSPSLDGDALVRAIPGLGAVAGLRVRSLFNRPSAHLSLAEALQIARAALEETEAGRGVVITHGTDTLEETAVLCDLLHGGDEPIVVTGAMRPASSPGADGPANLVDAVTVAGSAAATGLGGLVVFGGRLHAARAVRKVDSAQIDAFASPGPGPVGEVVEGRVLIARRPVRPAALTPNTLDGRVFVVSSGLGVDEAMLDAAIAADADGIVLVAVGAGHLSPPLLRAATRALAGGLPIVVVTRPERGAILRETYRFEGCEADVRDAGLVIGGGLSAAAARMTLLAALGAGRDLDGIRAAFATDDP